MTMRLVAKLRHLLGRGARLRRLEEEMRTHVDLLTEEGLRQGLTLAEARRRAHLAFGNVLATREESEDALGWPRLESWVHDARIASRSLLRRPAFAASLVAILALGIGVTTAIFTLVRGVLWQPLPVPHPAELHVTLSKDHRPTRLSAPALRRLEADPAVVGRVLGYTDNCRLTLRVDNGAAEPVQGQFVNGGFFSALQIGALRGRVFTAADHPPGEPAALAVISWHWWQRKLAGDPEVVGRTLRLNGVNVTVIGVAPKSFAGVSLGASPDLWLPLGLHAALGAQPSAWSVSRDDKPIELRDWVRDEHVAWVMAMVRVTPGTATAQGALEAAWRPQLAAFSDVVEDPAARLELSRDVPHLAPSPEGYSSTRNRFRTVGLTLSLLVGAVILVTAANSSTLLLLRMLARTRELGVRLALGAGRWRLARGALMEGLVLSGAGAVLGLIIGLWLTPLLAEWLVPGAVDVLPGVNGAMLGLLAGLAVALGLGLGAGPAWLSAHLSPQTILQQRGAGLKGSLRLGRMLIVLQLALSVLLISVAASLALDLRRVLNAELGYARESVITTFFDYRAAGFTRPQEAGVTAHLRQAAAALPRVRAVGFAGSGVLSGSRSQSGVYFRGTGVKQPDDSVQTESIDEHYFSAMGMTLLRGRGFTADDRENTPHVAIISQRLAREVFGAADPIGRRFGFDQNPSPEDWEIVGIAGDARVNDVRADPAALFYLPLAQWGKSPHCLVVRVEGDAAIARELLRRQVSAAEPALMFTQWRTLEERVRQWVSNDVAAVRLTAGFGVLATLLAAIGVFGALGYLVASRSREIAVRLAIGAEPSRVGRDIVREALVLGLAGAALGLGLALALPHWLGSWMMTGLRTDWFAIALAVGAGLVAALLGGLWPARRAAKVDPLTLLRSE